MKQISKKFRSVRTEKYFPSGRLQNLGKIWKYYSVRTSQTVNNLDLFYHMALKNPAFWLVAIQSVNFRIRTGFCESTGTFSRLKSP